MGKDLRPQVWTVAVVGKHLRRSVLIETLLGGGSFPEHNFYSFAPAFVNADELAARREKPMNIGGSTAAVARTAMK